LRDFLGKYYINLNGVVPNNYPEITQINKQEIIDFVVLISKDTHKDCIKKSEVEKFVSQRKTDGQVSYRLGYNEALDDLSNIIK